MSSKSKKHAELVIVEFLIPRIWNLIYMNLQSQLILKPARQSLPKQDMSLEVDLVLVTRPLL